MTLSLYSMANRKDAKRPKWMPMMYVNYFGLIQKLANEHGYALCVHGSVVRDFDLVCVPFDEVVKPHEELIAAIRKEIGLDTSSDPIFDKIGYEPHGRICYTVECGGSGYFDISFTPTMQQAIKMVEDRKVRRKEIKTIIASFKEGDTHAN